MSKYQERRTELEKELRELNLAEEKECKLAVRIRDLSQEEKQILLDLLNDQLHGED